MFDELSDDFHQAMLNLYREIIDAKLGYDPSVFLDMVHQRGGVDTARRLIRRRTYGFNRLQKLGRLDLSVEAHVLQERWAPLFSDAERSQARRRLEEYGYAPRADVM